jgi:hypothetical protein
MVAVGEPLMLPHIGLLALAAIAAGLAAGCAEQPQIYRWGVYEQVVYDMYANPGTADPETQVIKLSEDIARTQSEGKRVPPGVHAHLGYMYYLAGNSDAAVEEFASERDLFPASAVFIDGVFERLRQE